MRLIQMTKHNNLIGSNKNVLNNSTSRNTISAHIYTQDNTDLQLTIIQGIPDNDPRILGPTKLESNMAGKSKRNTFACVRCHSLKQKCVPSDPNDIYRKPCIRCLKRKKKCTFDLAKRTRKRKARTPKYNHETLEQTSPIDSISSVNSNSIETSSVIQYSGNITPRGPFINTPITKNTTTMVSDNPPSTSSTENKNDNNNMVEKHINIHTNLFQNNLPLDPPTNVLGSNSSSVYTSLPKTNMKTEIPKHQNNNINNNQFVSTFVPAQINPLTEKNLLSNEKYYAESTGINNNMLSRFHPIASETNFKQLSKQIVNNNNHDNNIKCSNSSGLELLHTAIFSAQDNLSNSSNGVRNEIPTANNVTQNKVIPPLSSLNIMSFSDNLKQPINDRSNEHKQLTCTTNLINKDDSNLIAIKKKTQYHMNHDFKKNLRSLLILLKGKVSEISNKFNLWSTQWNKLVENSLFLPTISDPVYIGIISMEEAELRLKLYTDVIAHQSRLPFVHIRDGASVNDIRMHKPIFFSVVMSIVSKVMTEEQTTRDTVMKLDSFVINLITIQIFKLNNKSIEVIEALVTLCMWYNFLEWSNKTRYHLFNYICCCLLKDLSPASVNRLFGMFNDDTPNKNKVLTKSLLEQAENGSELTLLVYISALNISIYLRQTIHARWNFVTENAIEKTKQRIENLKLCLKESNKTNNNITSLKLQIEEYETLITFAKLNHLLEKIHIHLHEIKDLRDDKILFDYQLTEQYIQRLIDRFQKELDEVLREIPNSRSRVLAFYYSVEAYLHQFTLNNFIRFETIEKKTELPSNITKAFLRCYECCTTSLREFLTLSDTLIASLPLFHISRIIYIVGMLMLKLRYAAVSIPAFHHFVNVTDGTIDLVKQVSTSLENASKKFPYNTGLYKFQYVVVLFGQTYATKVTELAEKMEHNEEQAKMNKGTQFNTQLIHSEDASSRKTHSDPMNLNTINNQISTPSNIGFVSELKKENENIRKELPNNNNNNTPNINISSNLYSNSRDNSTIPNDKKKSIEENKKDISFKSNLLAETVANTNAPIGQTMLPRDSSSSIASDNLNDYLTDINSLALGYNALNDEFWTDLLFNGT